MSLRVCICEICDKLYCSDMDFALAIIKADDGTSSFQVGGKSFSKGEAAAHEVTRVRLLCASDSVYK